MGANGSYDKNFGGVPKDKRTHTETGYTVLGHKVLLQTGTEDQTSNILNSNSPDSTYLMAKLNEDDTLTILNINVNKGHKIGMDINLKFDSHGNLIPYNGKESASHSHKWIEKPNGNMARKPAINGENTHLPISDEFKPLLNAIVDFNKKKNKFPKK
ncbi:MAG: hypothetical protein IJK46_13565 [Prevotella sp.]|jgi:hypothetical protein|nr:hypothetical protein [Prevotella sp.]